MQQLLLSLYELDNSRRRSVVPEVDIHTEFAEKAVKNAVVRKGNSAYAGRYNMLLFTSGARSFFTF
jgi:hypothetical protein